ncbi:MAG: DUF2971 domain-containing protein [Pedobacter sp.]|nr:MAG: DUF2971 domain-containing protein [Pedobacter sp.]
MPIIKFLANSEFLFANLASNQLYFNNVGNFNDPFEGGFRYRITRNYGEFKSFYLNNYLGSPDKLEYHFNHIEEFEQKLNSTFTWRHANNAVTCFSHSINEVNVLMWSHYANNHNGVCLHFDEKKLKFANKLIGSVGINAPTGPNAINYTDKYLNEDPSSQQLNARNFLTTKFTPWSYEKESRYIAPQSGLYTFDPGSLIEVTFGLRLRIEDRIAIETIIKDKYPSASLSQIELERSAFELKKTPIC